MGNNSNSLDLAILVALLVALCLLFLVACKVSEQLGTIEKQIVKLNTNVNITNLQK